MHAETGRAVASLTEPDRAMPCRKEPRVIQFVAELRRVAAATAAVALLSGLSPASARAQAPPAAPDSTAAPAPQSSPTPQPPSTPAPKSTAATSTKGAKPSKTSKPKKSKAAKAAPAAAAAKVAPKSMAERRKIDGSLAQGGNWVTLRFGYAKRTGDLTGDGYVGYGAAYQRMLAKHFAFAAGVGHDVVAHFGDQLDVMVPFTVELQRHFKWSTDLHPYLGVGGGYYYRKMYRTGTDYDTRRSGGAQVSIGVTSELDDRHVVGFEARVAFVRGNPDQTNPTFGPGSDTETIWTAKLIWGLFY